MSKKQATTTTSKVSAAPATSSNQKSSLLKSSFAPSRFQLRLFASVIQSFDSQQLRIHDTNTSRLRCVHHAKPNAKINCLDWGRYTKSKAGQKSSKKTKAGANTDAVIAYGTSESEICIFSPAEGKLVETLTGAHERGVYDVKFSQHQIDEAWSIGGDATLVQWDLKSDRAIRTIPVADPAIKTLSSPSPISPHFICASSTPYAMDLETSDPPRFEHFDSMKNPIHTLFRSGLEGNSKIEFLLSSDHDRYINIYDMDQKHLVRTLIAGAGVRTADLLNTKSDGVDAQDSQILAVVTNEGTVELFTRPFVPPVSMNGDVVFKRKGLTQKSNAKVKLIISGTKNNHVPVASASLQGPELFVATVDGGVDVSFQKIRWQDEGTGELLFDGTKEVSHVRTASSFKAATTNGIKDVTKSHVDESRTVVVNGVGDLDSEDVSGETAIDVASSDDEEGEQDDEDVPGSEINVIADEADSDEEMEDAKENLDSSLVQPGEEEDENTEEPSFGELLASKTSQAIEIADAFRPESTALAKIDNGQLSLPTGMSLGTVLTQSLRTNDRTLLEACLHTTDLDVVRNTIQRLDSSLAGILLSKLAERMSSRPGRYGSLQTWVQQLCIAHGAAISSQPAVRNQVRTLYQVLDQRAKSLSHLMLLKGKLDMLDAQIKFRKQLAAQRSSRQDKDGGPSIIYVEGQDDNWSSDDDHDEAVGSSTRQLTKPNARKGLEEFADEEDSDDEDMPLTNGISGSDAEEDDEEEEDDVQPRSGTLVDDEAADEEEDEEEEDSEQDGDSEEEDEEEQEEEEEDDSEMDSFVNDGSISLEQDEDEEEVDETPQTPASKRSRHR